MNRTKLTEARKQAEEFIKRVDKLSELSEYYSPKESASVRRQSMELTRSLAELRKRD